MIKLQTLGHRPSEKMALLEPIYGFIILDVYVILHKVEALVRDHDVMIRRKGYEPLVEKLTYPS